MRIVGIDPGRNTGVAIFDDGFLVDVSLAKPDMEATSALGLSTVNLFGAEVVIEVPQIYRGSKSKGDPNDLIGVAVLVGRFTERAYNQGARPDVVLVKPHTWKGSVPKEIHQERIKTKLTAPEMAILKAYKCGASVKHNVVDAIGLGLWRLGR